MIFISILIFILAMSLPFFKTHITPIFFTRITALAFIYAGLLNFNALHFQAIGSGIGIYSGYFQITYFSLFIETFLYTVGALILFSWPLLKRKTEYPIQSALIVNEYGGACSSALEGNNTENQLATHLKTEPVTAKATQTKATQTNINFIKNEEYFKKFYLSSTGTEFKEYSLIALFSTLGGSFLLSAGDLLSMYLSIELQSFGLYILATIYRDSRSATGAGLKYFLLGGLSSCLILLGASLIYSFTGLTNFESLYSLISVISTNAPLSFLSNLEIDTALSSGSNIEVSNLNTLNLGVTESVIPLLSSEKIVDNLEGLSQSTLNINNTPRIVSSSMTDGLFPPPTKGWRLAFNLLSIEGLNHNIISSLTENVSQGLSLGLILIIAGFLFKIAGAPFHNWAPDVYDESPTNVTIWLIIMPKIAILIFLLECSAEMGIISQLTQPILNNIFPITVSLTPEAELFNLSTLFVEGNAYLIKNIFLLSSLLSLVIGTVVGLAQRKIKRLLAYSTISHVGFLLLALAINTEQSTESLILYLIQYILTSLNTFFILLAFGYLIKSSQLISQPLPSPIYDERSRIGSSSRTDGLFSPPTKRWRKPQDNLRWLRGSTHSSVSQSFSFVPYKHLNANSDINLILELKGQFVSNPILSLSLAICLFSMAGIPPLIGFFGKQSVLYSAIGQGYIFMALLAIIVSVISAYYYLRIIKELHSESTFPPFYLSSNHTETLLSLDPQNKPQISYHQNNSSALPSLEKGEWDKENLFQSSQVKNKLADREELSIVSKLIVTNIHSFLISTFTLTIIFFILKPSIILNSTVLLSLSLFNG